MLLSGEDKNPLLNVAGSDVRRYSERLFLMPALPTNSLVDYSLNWDGAGSLEIASCGNIDLGSQYTSSPIRVAFRQGSERCKPIGRSKSQSLKKLFQEYKLEPWLRDCTPLLWRGDELVAVAGLFSCVEDMPTPNINWQLTTKIKPAN